MYNNDTHYQILDGRGVVMEIGQVAKGIYQLSVTIRDMLFEGMWEIPQGVTLNSYIVTGDKTALIDGVCGWDGVPENFFALMDQLNIRVEDVDYLVINHMEPDHSGWIEQLHQVRPDFTIVCNRASQELLEAFYGYTENIMVIQDGDTLNLGQGKELSFITMPNVHWPDSMLTYENVSGTLFSCDVFGSFGAIDGKRYDDQLTKDEVVMLENEALRYYSNIVGTYTSFAKKGVKKLEDLNIEIVAPGHGIVWREDPKKIIMDYDNYINWQTKPRKDEVTVIFGSMYGMTEKAVTHIIETLEDYPVKVKVCRVPEDSWGIVLGAIWSSANVILAMPTYEYKMFPPMAAVLEEIGKKKVLNRHVFRLGSYGWSGGAQKELDQLMDKMKLGWTFVESVEFKGQAQVDDLKSIEASLQELLLPIRIESPA